MEYAGGQYCLDKSFNVLCYAGGWAMGQQCVDDVDAMSAGVEGCDVGCVSATM